MKMSPAHAPAHRPSAANAEIVNFIILRSFPFGGPSQPPFRYKPTRSPWQTVYHFPPLSALPNRVAPFYKILKATNKASCNLWGDFQASRIPLRHHSYSTNQIRPSRPPRAPLCFCSIKNHKAPRPLPSVLNFPIFIIAFTPLLLLLPDSCFRYHSQSTSHADIEWQADSPPPMHILILSFPLAHPLLQLALKL